MYKLINMMKNIVTILMVLISLAGISQTKYDTIRIGDDINYDLIYDLAIEHLNDLRKKYHSGHSRDLVKNDSLMNYAKFHSKDMLEKDSVFHDNPPSSEVCHLGGGLLPSMTYEVVAKSLIERFRSSPPHWKILMDGSYKSIGISFTKEIINGSIVNYGTMYSTINMGYSLDFPKNLVDWENYTVDTNF